MVKKHSRNNNSTHTTPEKNYINRTKFTLQNRKQYRPVQPINRRNHTKIKLITLKFKSTTSFNSNFKNYFTLQKEIKRCKPNAKIVNAYISSQEELIIKVDSQTEETKLKSEWPTDAFTSGFELINKKVKFYLALKNVDIDFDITDHEILTFMTSGYNITSLLRLVKKM